MADDRVWLESVLKRKAYEDSPQRVLECKSGAAVGKNENYLSKMTRLEATVLLGSGKTKKISVMVKNSHVGGVMKQLSDSLGVFVREIAMYRDILPQMADLMEEFGDQEEPMWPECYHVTKNNRLVLEDLSVRGFKMGKRIEQLSLDACLVVVKSLAKFHGLSHILLKGGDIPLGIFGKNAFVALGEYWNNMGMVNYNNLMASADTWGDEWKDVRKRFESAMPSLTQRMMEATEPTNDDFVVLCHGDCWTNNLLFKKASDSETPVAMKFVDFQMCFAAPASYDLEYLFVTSLPTEIYKNNLDLILQTYCVALKSTMLKLNYEGPVPDFNATKLLMKRTHILYLYNAINIIPVILGESEDIPDMENLVEVKHDPGTAGSDSAKWNLHKNLKGRVKTVIQFALRDAVENGLI